MNCTDLGLAGPRLLEVAAFRDARGFFLESYSQRTFQGFGIDLSFVQDNHSYSKHPGTIRGLHYQSPPFAQAKLVRVVRGRIMDVVVDVRRGSPSYGRSVSAELSADNGQQMLVPAGFLHGFLTLEPDTDVIYKVTSHYSREHEGTVLWNDPDLGIDWGITAETARVSEKDAAAVPFSTFESPFVYQA